MNPGWRAGDDAGSLPPSSQAPGGFPALLPSPVPRKACCDHPNVKNTFGFPQGLAAVGPKSTSLGLSLCNMMADLLRKPPSDGDSAAAWISLFITLTGG